MEIHCQSLEEASTQAGGEAHMPLPGVQTILGFRLMAVFNRRFEHFSTRERTMHFPAFLLVALTMGLMLAPAALDTYLIGKVILKEMVPALAAGLGTFAVLAGLWFVLPVAVKPPGR